MINPSSDKFVSLIRLQAPDVSINLGDLVDSAAMYNSLSSTGEVWKYVRKLVAIESMGKELDGELHIRTLVRPPDESEVAFEETKTFANRNRR